MSGSFKTRFLKQGLLIGGCLVLGNVLAGGPEVSPAPSGLPIPGVSLYGLGGNGWTAMGDVLAPVFGQASGFAYVDPQIYYHSGDDNGYTGSLGAGYRHLSDTAGILGAYVFGDYNRSTDGHNFWFVSPGIERLGQILDFSANAYIPVSSQRIDTGTKFADQVGEFNDITFAGHDQYDELVNTFTSTGYGGDVQVGVHLPFFRNSEVFLGGYYFAPKDTDNIGGGAVRLQVPVNQYLAVLVSEAYDSQYHNTVKAGLTLWFGGRHTGYGFNGDLTQRLVDPIQRGLVAVAGGARTLEPSLSDFDDTNQRALELSNISFFMPETGVAVDAAAVQGNGTFENPYVGMTQDNVDDANGLNNRNFYIDSGTYTAMYGGMNDYILLNNDQLYGRQDGFKEAAQGASRPIITFSDGGFEVPATDVNDSITGLQLFGMNADGRAGIWIDHENSPLNQLVTIDNTTVQAFGDGIDLLNSGAGALTVNVNDSLISNNNGNGELFSTFLVTGGIGAVNDSGAGALQLNVSGSTIAANNKTFNNAGAVFRIEAVGGLAALNEAMMTINVTNSSLSNNTISAADSSLLNAAGGLAAFGSDMTIKVIDSTLSGNTISADNSGIEVAGGLAIASEDNVTVEVSRSDLSGNTISANNGSSINVAGGLAMFNSGGNVTLDVSRSDLSGNSLSVDNGGMFAAGGLAVLNSFESDMTMDISRSDLSSNTISANNGGGLDVAGGLAVDNEAVMTIVVRGSHLSGNTVSANNSRNMFAAGGLAVANVGNPVSGTTLSLDVRDSNLSGNSILANNTPIASAGGLAVLNSFGSNMTVDISRSNLSRNTISANNGSTMNAAGGLAVTNGGNNMTINVSRSTLSNNTISADNSSTITTAGGLAALNSSINPMTIDVRRSILTNNTGSGIAVDGPADVTVNKSIIAWNTNFGLSAVDGAMINVTNPIFFDGVVNIQGASTITFPTIGNVANLDHVVCTFFGTCSIEAVTP